jgi:hypothetical protein
MKSRRCPVCKSPLTEEQYNKALGIVGKLKDHLTHQIANLRGQLRESRQKISAARSEGITAERSRSQRLMQGQKETITKLRDRVRQLQKGSTPQSEGLDFETSLVAKFRREFGEDDIQHKGKGGDILHTVKFKGETAGIIIYECKKCPGIKPQHIRQTGLAKQSREADFAVLITSGTKRGFGGLGRVNGILIVSPLGALALASLLRVQLIEMLRAKLDKGQRAAIAEKLLEFVTTPQFKNRIEEIIETSSELQDMVQDEARAHYRVWKKRLQLYKTIEWDGSIIQENLRLVLHGKEPKTIAQRVVIPLQLPVPTEK